MKNVYTAEVVSQGGREGTVSSSDGSLQFKLAKPAEMGGKDPKAHNPEQLFAAAYSACFNGALQSAASKAHVTLQPGTVVKAFVRLKEDDSGGYHLQPEIRVSMPGVDRSTAEKVIQQAHQTCPYSKAMRERIEVPVTLD